MAGPNSLGRRADLEVTKLRIDSRFSVAEMAAILKSRDALRSRLTALFSVTYDGYFAAAKMKQGARVSALFLRSALSKVAGMSDAHRHDDVAIAIRLVGQRAHLAGGLF